MTRLLWIVGLSMIVASPALAQDGDDERARGHFLAGRSYFDQGRYSDAAEQFEEAFGLSRRSTLLLNAATAYERALQFDRAATTLERYLELEPDSDDRATLEERIRRVREMAERASDGEAGETPAGDAPPGETPPPAARPPTSNDDLGVLGISGIAVGGAGVAGIVAAIATGVVALDTHASLTARCGADGTSCPPGSQEDIDSGSTMALASTVLLPIGLVAVGVGALLLVLDLTDGGAQSEVALIGGPGEVGLGLDARF